MSGGNNKMSLKSFIKNHKNLYILSKCILCFKQDRFKQYIIDYNRNIDSISNQSAVPSYDLKILSYGKQNPGKIIMYLENQGGHAGFCSLWIYFLNRLSFSDRMGFKHVINCSQSDFYQENHLVDGTNNVFEYYFQQPSSIEVKDVFKSKNVVIDYNSESLGFNDYFHSGGGLDYHFNDQDINDFACIQKKYIHLKTSIEMQLQADFVNLLPLNKKIIGVHARGTDSKINYKGHPNSVSINEYIIEAQNAIDKTGAEYVFLATDDLEILDCFKQTFGDALIFYSDVIRSSGTKMNCFSDYPRENHRFKLGYEIIRDVFTLAQCDSFICGMSYVSMMVQVVNRAYYDDFKYFSRIFKGIREDGINLEDINERNKIKEEWEKSNN